MMPHCAPRFGETVLDLEDPCRFPPILTDLELYLLGEGTQQRLYDKLRVAAEVRSARLLRKFARARHPSC